jgi:hypothetical protein
MLYLPCYVNIQIGKIYKREIIFNQDVPEDF